jgi:TolB protein
MMRVRGLRRWLPVTVAGMTLLGLAVIADAQASTIAGTNGKIAFIRFDPASEGASQTFTIDPDGTHETLIPGGAQWEFGCHGWSPEGSKLVLCIANASGFVRPATANPDGSDFTLLDAYPNLPLNLACERWSPDARRLLCQSEDESSPATNGIYTVRSSDGGGLVRVTSQPEGRLDMPVGYSPDGSRILFLRNDSDGNWGDLFEVNPDGTGLLRLNPPGLLAASSSFDGDFGLDDCCGVDADWSPDGSQVAFGARWKASAHLGTQFALYIVNADGGGLQRISPRGIGAGRDGVKWSPDGRLIAFSTRRQTVHYPQIYVVQPDGTGMRELTKPTHLDMSVGPVWSPDSTKILFQSFHPEINSGQEDLWIINADGTGLRQLTHPVEGLGPGEEAPTWGSAPVG